MAEAFLRLSREDQTEALGVAATASGRPPHILEKDVWVVWALSALFNSAHADHLVFKGGTSLSKAYGVIDRFSEDIDVTYDIRRLVKAPALEGNEAAPDNPSQQRAWRKTIEQALPAWIDGEMAPHIAAQLQAQALDARTEVEGDKLWIRHAPASEGWGGYMSPDVMIEFGGRSTGLPADVIAIQCDAAAHLPELEFPTAAPRVMHVHRTFWEKATAVHVFCRQGQLKGDRQARHWYDLVQLDETGHAAGAFADRGLATQVAGHKTAFFAVKGVDYHAAVGGDLSLVPEGEMLEAVRSDYAQMLSSGLLNEAAPTFDDLIEHCRTLQVRANAG